MEYQQFIQTVKNTIESSQIKAAIAVNKELLRLYWFLGGQIAEKQKTAQWGDGLIKRMSTDLQHAFPEMKGMSLRNMKYMKQWFDFWSQDSIIGQQVVAQLEWQWAHGAFVANAYFKHLEATFSSSTKRKYHQRSSARLL